MTIYGYARVSMDDQKLERQFHELKAAGCRCIYEEKTSGITTQRPGLQQMLADLQEGDVVIVTDLTRITRNRNDLFNLLDIILSKGASIKSLQDEWLDTTEANPHHAYLLTVIHSTNQLERDIIKMRQQEGIALAKEKGAYRGRMKTYNEEHPAMNEAIQLYLNGTTVKEITDITKITKSTLYRELQRRGLQRR